LSGDPRLGGDRSAESPRARNPDDGAMPSHEAPIVFVSDPTAEAERVARALRARAYTVVDVPLSMLVARVAVQHPDVVLVDADSHGALDVVSRMRELPQADDVHVFFVAAPGGAIGTLDEAQAHEGSGFALRPIDVAALVHEIELLSGTAHVAVPDPRSSTPPPSIAAPQPKRPSNPPSFSPGSLRGGPYGLGVRETVSFSEPPAPSSRAPLPKALSLAPPMSADLARMLAEAERRIDIPVADESAPSPEQEIESVLPADLLSALDEPLDEEDEGDGAPARSHSPTGSPGARDRTTDGGATRTTGASTGGGSTPSTSNPGRRGNEEGLTPPPWAPSVPPFAPPRAPRGTSPDSVSAAPVEAEAAPADPKTLRPEVGYGEALRVVGKAIASRTSGSLCVLCDPRASSAQGPDPAEAIERRVVLREGDLVTCASSAEEESLMAFLGVRGDLPKETVRRLRSKFPPFGRHAGAALVARGYLLQDQMWPTLRAHAEWVLGRVLGASQVRAVVEPQPPGRLAGEPSVFGGAPGAEVFVDVVRRVVSPADALERLGGAASRLGRGASGELLDECGLAPAELEAVRRATAAAQSVGDVLEAARDTDFASALLALTQLGVADVLRAVSGGADADAPDLDVAAIEAEAVRERVRARLQLVDDGDYFAVLGVARDATGYEVKRAFLELRRTFDPSRLLSPELSDLAPDVHKITTVLEEAFEILKDGARRERYRRAIDGSP
jgi:hypothetical protein